MYLKKKLVCIPLMTSGDESQTFVSQVSLYVLPAYVVLSTFLCGWSFLRVFWILIPCWVHFKYLLWGYACLQSWSSVSLLLLQNSSGLPALIASFIGCLSCAGHWTVLFNRHSHPVWGRGGTVILWCVEVEKGRSQPGWYRQKECWEPKANSPFLQSWAFKSCIT